MNDLPNQATSLNTSSSTEKRITNFIVDLIVVRVILLGIVTFFAFSSGEGLDTKLKFYLLYFGAYLLYFILFEALFKRTIGKLISGTKVVSWNGERPAISQIIIRSLVRIIPFEALSFFFRGSHPIGLHDRLSKTLVVPSAYQLEQIKSIDTEKKDKNHGLLKRIGVAILVLALLAVGKYFESVKVEEATPWQVTYESLGTDTPDFGGMSKGNIYQNDTYGVTVQFPEGWTTYPGTGPFVDYFAWGGDALIDMSLFRQPLKSSRKQYGGLESIKDLLSIEDSIESLETISPRGRDEGVLKREVLSANESVVNGEDAFIIELEITQDVDGTVSVLREIHYKLAKGNVRYGLAMRVDPERYEEYKPIFLNVVETLRIEKTWVDFTSSKSTDSTSTDSINYNHTYYFEEFGLFGHFSYAGDTNFSVNNWSDAGYLSLGFRGSGDNIDMLARALSSDLANSVELYGSNPIIETLVVNGNDARLIRPTAGYEGDYLLMVSLGEEVTSDEGHDLGLITIASDQLDVIEGAIATLEF